ncbi:MAG: HEAT repeat domain-containing protein [Woeseiaceae bacterium]
MCIRCVILIAVLSGVAPGWSAEPVARYENGVVSLNADDATLATIFESLAAAMPLSVYSGQDLESRVTIDFVIRSVDQFVRQLLRQRSYTLVHDTNSDQFEVWIFADVNSPKRRVIIGDAAAIDSENIDDEVAWNRATSALLDPNSDTRVEALFTMADIDSAAATDLMRVALNDSERSVRRTAIELLGAVGAVSILQESWWLLPSSEQILVVDALGDIETPQSSSFLRVVAGSNNAELATAADQYLAERR